MTEQCEREFYKGKRCTDEELLDYLILFEKKNGRVEKGGIFECPFCSLKINVHVNAAINIRNKSKIYQDLKKIL